MSQFPWSTLEVEATVRDYLDMLLLELRGIPFNKSEHNEQLRRILNNRTRSAVEFKHQNISAVLIGFGMPYIKGYQPRGNVQKMLRDTVREHISPPLRQLVEQDVRAKAESICVDDVDLLGMRVDAPQLTTPQGQPNRLAARDEGWAPPATAADPVDYLAIEERNHSLGDAGEALVLEYEKAHLCRAGCDHLARNVEQVSRTIGDRAGYDIRSYEVDGCDRFIEVKTTRYGKFTPFFISASEVRFSEKNALQYKLYRLFEYRRKPRLFVLPGNIRANVHLQATDFRARF